MPSAPRAARSSRPTCTSEDVVGLADELTRNGPVELVVNNVGITTPHRLLELGTEELDLVLGTNLKGPGCSPTGW